MKNNTNTSSFICIKSLVFSTYPAEQTYRKQQKSKKKKKSAKQTKAQVKWNHFGNHKKQKRKTNILFFRE